MTTQVNIVGIHELDFDLSGVTTATVTSPGVVLITNVPANSTHEEVLTDGQSNIIYAMGDIIMVIGVPN